MNSIIAIGGLHFGSLVNQRGVSKLISLGLDNGIDLIDSAPMYGHTESERLIGKAIRKLQDPPKIATKVGLLPTFDANGNFGVEIDRLIKKNIDRSVDKSLKNLGVDQIEILTLHAYDQYTPLDVTLDAIDQLKKDGKIKQLSCSNYNPQQLKELIRCCKKISLPLQSAQVHYNMIERRAESKFIRLCVDNDIQVHVNRGMARGALSGKYISSIPVDSRAYASLRITKWLNDERMSLIKALKEVCDNYGISMLELVISWFRSKSYDLRVIMGFRTTAQLIQVVKATKMRVNESLLSDIEKIVNSYKFVQLSPRNYLEK